MARKNKKVAYTWRVQWTRPDTHQQVLLNGLSGTLSTSVLSIITAAEMAEFDDNALVKRVVGTFFWYAQGAADPGGDALGEIAVHAGMYVAEEDSAFSPVSPTDVQDVRWSWLRQWRTIGSGATNEGGNYGRWDDASGYVSAVIDVGINRRMREGDELKFCLAASCISPAGGWNILGATNLRILMEV